MPSPNRPCCAGSPRGINHRSWTLGVSVLTMVAGSPPPSARHRAREHAAKLLDAEDAERRRREAERRKRVTDNVAEVAANDAEIGQLTKKIEDLRADTA